MNEEEMARRIEKLEEEMDTIKQSLRALEHFRETFVKALEQWDKRRK